MKTNNNKGFTLIELIMVIVILGILSAVAVPKFFDLTTSAQIKNKQAVLGNIKSGLQLFAADRLVKSGSKTYPSTPIALTRILDEVPENWSLVVGTATTDSLLYHQGGGDWVAYILTGLADSSKVTIGSEVVRKTP